MPILTFMSGGEIVKSLRKSAMADAEEGEYHVREHIESIAADYIEEKEAEFSRVSDRLTDSDNKLFRLGVKHAQCLVAMRQLDSALNALRYLGNLED